MPIVTKKKVGFMSVAVLFLVNFGYMADMAIIPAASAIYTQFYDAPEWLLNFILSGPQLVGVISAIIMAVIMRRLSKRTLIIGLFTLFTVSSCLGAAVVNPWYVAGMRALTGFAAGGLAPVALALIHELYADDEAKCNMLIGSFNGVTAVIGAVMSIVAGILCVVSWTNVFYEYLAAIPMLVLLIIFVPKTPPEREVQQQSEMDEANESTDWKRVAALIGSLLVLGVIFNIISYECSMYIDENALGDSVFAGILSSVITVATAVACFLFEPMFKRMGRYMAPLMYMMIGVGFLGTFFIFGQIWLVVCCAVIGFGYGIAMSYFFVYATVIVPSSKVSPVIGVVSATVGLGAFLCTYASSAIMSLFGISQLKDLFLVYAGILGVGFVISAVLAVRCNKLM